jgi:hypothetical protein
MTRIDVSRLSVDDLLKWHVEFSSRQGAALELLLSTRSANRAGDQIRKINEELKSRPGDQRAALVRLFTHPNLWVQLNAAEAAIPVAPVAARQQIQIIADSKKYPVAGHAGMFLSFYDGDLSDI